MEIFDYSIKKNDDLLKQFNSTIDHGLSFILADERLKQFGQNQLPAQKPRPVKIFLRQFKSVFIYLLLVAIAITLLLNQRIDALMIFIFLAVNTTLGFFQEYRSEKTIQLLHQYLVPKTKILRQGKISTMLSSLLVPGDIIVLETGDKITADVRFIEAHNVTVNESVLTGESVPASKTDQALSQAPLAYYQASNLGFFGTTVVSGKAKALVLATGKKTSFAAIAQLATDTRQVSDFEKGISKFSRFILKLVGLTLLAVFLANILIKPGTFNFIELLIFTIALTVSVVPEALPLVTTFSLSLGAQRLAKKNVLVKRLSAVEDLGGIEVLCTDKTGTLTKNELTVANVYSDQPEATVLVANLASAFEQQKKLEPFDIALWKNLTTANQAKVAEAEKIKEEPFSPENKRNIALIHFNQHYQLVSRGAPEVIVPLCHHVSAQTRHNIEQWVQREGQQGHRTLAIASKKISGAASHTVELSQETGYEFLGVVSFVDEVKPSAKQAAADAKKLGIALKILTGDSPEVAGVVAKEIGLIDDAKKVIDGSVWHNWPQAKKLQTLKDFSVFARVSPEQKYEIVELLRTDFLVGFLGEGINDAPALKLAGVSLVVDSASDLAREVADIVILQKSLAVIIDGIAEGRQVFANTSKYIRATLASNFGNFFAIATTSLLIDFLPMLPVQILLVNLLSDAPMIAISTDSVDNSELVSPKKYEVREIVLFSLILGVVSTIFDFIFFGLFYRISPGVLQTNWFIGSILTELVFIFSVRTKSFFLKAATPSRSLMSLTLVAFFVTIALPYTILGQEFFHFVPPSAWHLILILGIVSFEFVISESAKLLFYRKPI